MRKNKIFNDPVHGFISIPHDFFLELINHRYFQRLRRILQLSTANFVYPGANHSRFHHALGAFYLMQQAQQTLLSKGVEISKEEQEGALIATLLHDIGHGPFSHTLEHSLIDDIHHEEISLLFMEKLRQELGGSMDIAIQIFKNTYPKKYLHQLVSGQLDVDRLDYLTRDSFYTGVNEGVINHDRILKMIDVHDGNLVVESKAIYSIEKFLVSRRIMYWQVYLHKTVEAAKQMLVRVMKRATELARSGVHVPASEPLSVFLNQRISKQTFLTEEKYVETFSLLDDHDIYAALKSWTTHDDFLLRFLSTGILHRIIFKTTVSRIPNSIELLAEKRLQLMKKYNCTMEEASVLCFEEEVKHFSYDTDQSQILIKQKNGVVQNILELKEELDLMVQTEPTIKYYLFEAI